MIELENPADENATVWSAFQQLQTCQAQVSALFAANVVPLASEPVDQPRPKVSISRARQVGELAADGQRNRLCRFDL